MKLKTKIELALTLAKAKFLGRRIPLAVRWQLTNRCPSRCLYCKLWQTSSTEMDTEQIFSVLDELADMGVKRISYSGGEPMLRNDIGEILDYTAGKGISVGINTNGFMVPEKINQLRSIDLLKISIDGPKEVDNKVRGHEDTYLWAISAADAALKQGIKFTFCTTLTKHNIGSLEFMVDLARRYNTMVAFQPLKTIYRGAKDIDSLYPAGEEWGKAMKELKRLKRKYPQNIRNSNLLLEYISNWPKCKKTKCWAGKVFCIIDTNGDVVPCDRVDYPAGKIPNCLQIGFKEAFKRIPDVRCSGCGFCGAMELNYLLNLNWRGARAIGRVIK